MQLSCRTSWKHRTRTRRSLPLVKLRSEFLHEQTREIELFVKNVIVTRAICFSDVRSRFSYELSYSFTMSRHVRKSMDNNFQFVGQTYRVHVNAVMRET